MDYIIYICSYFISGIILYLLMIDIKKFKNRLYYEITNEIWIKLYCLISILIIHLIWIFSIVFLNYQDSSIIYGIPYFLIIPYLLYLTIDFKKIDTIASEKINKYLNYIISFYLIIIIMIAVIPNKIKKEFIKCFKNIMSKYL